MVKYGLNLNLGFKFGTKARRTEIIDKVKTIVDSLTEEEIVKKVAVEFSEQPVSKDETIEGTTENIDL